MSELQVLDFELVSINETGKEIQRESRQAQLFSEDLGNGISLDMVAIPGGSFRMGANETEDGALSGSLAIKFVDNELDRRFERPQHQVRVKPFFMGKLPVTQAQWSQVAFLPRIDRYLEPDPSLFKGHLLPVERVDWYDSIEFCKRLSAKTGRDYRLPSEAEWEYACRAGTNTPFHFGETITTNLANYCGVDEKILCLIPWMKGSYNSGPKGVNRQKTTPAGSFQVANAFGLYDMHGNVCEWCADYWHNNYQNAPDDGREWLSGGYELYSVMRGGSWMSFPSACRSAARYSCIQTSRSQTIGLRVACSVA